MLIVPLPSNLPHPPQPSILQTVWIFVSQSAVLLPSRPFLYSSNR